MSKQHHFDNLVSITNKITDCAICMDTLKTPKGLPCFHTFCLTCLEKYRADTSPGDDLPCPLCRQIFKVPKDGFEKLPTNFFIQQLIESQFSNNATHEKERYMKCEMCGDEELNDTGSLIAEKYCIECDQRMCVRCDVTHSKARIGQSHKVVPIEDRQDILTSGASKPHYCESHKDQAIQLYCNDCKKPICLICKAVNHDGHPCTEVKEAAGKFVENMKNCFSEIGQQMDAVQGELIQQNEHMDDLLQQINKSELLISERCNTLVQVIEKQHDKLLEKLNTFKRERLKMMERRKYEIQRQSVILSSFKTYLEKLMEHGSAYEISRSAEDLLARATDLVTSHVKFRAGQLTRIHVTFSPANIPRVISSKVSLVGAVVLNDEEQEPRPSASMNFVDLHNKAQIVHVIPKQGSTQIVGIATLRSQIYVTRHMAEQITRYNTLDFAETGHVMIAGMKDPRGLVASEQLNSFFIAGCSANCIHKIDLSDSSTSQLVVHGAPWNIILGNSGNLLVTLQSKRQIQEITTDGRLLRKINLDASIDSPWQCVELSTGQLVVSHHGRTLSRVCIVDGEGRIVRSYGGPSGSAAGHLNNPIGLAVDSCDNIIVADYNNHKIRLLNSSLTHLGDVTLPGQQLNGPYCLQIDEINARLYTGEAAGGRMFMVSAPTPG